MRCKYICFKLYLKIKSDYLFITSRQNDAERGLFFGTTATYCYPRSVRKTLRINTLQNVGSRCSSFFAKKSFSASLPVVGFLSYLWGMNHANDLERARALYRDGQAAMKRSAWGEAISLFLQSEALDPDGPAREAREMLDNIMAFYNKDMYNQ